MATAQNILNDPFMNKGTAFTLEEREKNGSCRRTSTLRADD